MPVARRALALTIVALLAACRRPGPSAPNAQASPPPPPDYVVAPAPNSTAVPPSTATSSGAPSEQSALAAPTIQSHRTPPPGVPTAAQCAANEDCGPCMHAGCGWCGDESFCTSGDTHGPWEGSCHGRWTVSADCTISKHQIVVEEAAAEKRLAEVTGTLTREGQAIEARVEDKKKLTFEVRRGRCYAISFRVPLGTKTEWNVGSVVEFAVPFVEGGDIAELGMGRSALRKTCPQKDGSIKAYVGERSPRGGAIGQGPYTIELYSGPISEEELRAQAAAKAAADEERLVRAFCAACARDRLTCELRGGPGCISQHAACLHFNRLSPAACEAGRFVKPAPTPTGKPKNKDGTVDL